MNSSENKPLGRTLLSPRSSPLVRSCTPSSVRGPRSPRTRSWHLTVARSPSSTFEPSKTPEDAHLSKLSASPLLHLKRPRSLSILYIPRALYLDGCKLVEPNRARNRAARPLALEHLADPAGTGAPAKKTTKVYFWRRVRARPRSARRQICRFPFPLFPRVFILEHVAKIANFAAGVLFSGFTTGQTSAVSFCGFFDFYGILSRVANTWRNLLFLRSERYFRGFATGQISAVNFRGFLRFFAEIVSRVCRVKRCVQRKTWFFAPSAATR